MHLILGLGDTGFSCVRYLLQQKKSIMVADTRATPSKLRECQQLFPEVSIHLGKFHEKLLENVTTVVISPGVSLNEPVVQLALQKNIPVIGDIELFARAVKVPIVAITGSNGKTTLTTLMGKLISDAGFRAVMCGNIGLPVLDTLQQPAPDYYVMELSSFQLQTTFSLRAAVAVVINISPDHLDRHKDDAEYLAAKQRIYLNCEQAIVNTDEPEIWKTLSFNKSPIEFTLKTPHQNQWGLIENYLTYGHQKIISVTDLLLQEHHNLQNFLVALAMGTALNMPLPAMLATLKSFSGLAHRCERVQSHDQIRWYNDSKATNVGAAIAAIHSIGKSNTGKMILIAGGDGKGVSFASLRAPVQKYISQVILLGKDADQLEIELKDCARMTRVCTIKEAVAAAKKIAQPGDVVLLSPACSSLDQYESYVARGKDFVSAVNAHG
ncbi:MAG: UDP-N-acetylmuramoyl-L-alanyl-D-glutamate synthetase [uncultured bacterium]|nr:MAG: UDP-N-acetylmuramoyl-L-alanyl-D-glutamate synthetase [uncultured bacterium]OGT26093.1 MAG: UDP-N-acetylmuramoylalanine--D-glutamate ligase [Gammaproteobacteria bacterium RIFCSPHIGHO2_02_FULL_42_43]OGT50884.1 MAG: UDP-N-acetylmuramoylalanine--D-glutamate ligase [Gammaproteobacteria bacterium RIFCSPHIGHO2_12_FULL_41_25]OGT62835.1 MAG: UDP-N-acetylmuramoylalanine--D-glutamate ligase [Gammaproteobacteria bacterium RIFCSPLOWO2_02_FULL_42_14]OGT86793.1 MAG: UDP-N-acetylmuramoylalanine--D-glut